MYVEPVGFLAAGVPVAAEIDVAVVLDKVGSQHAHCVDVVVERGVIVPCQEEAVAMCVEKDYCRGKGVVVVNYVGEVGHGFVAFVQGCRKNIGI